MNLGIAVLLVIGAWSLLSVVVSVTIGGVAGFRDTDRTVQRFRGADSRARDQRDRLAS